MFDMEFRFPEIPDDSEVPAEERAYLKSWLNEKYLGEKLDEAIYTQYTEEQLFRSYEKKRPEVIHFLVTELFSIFLELKLQRLADLVGVKFEKNAGGAALDIDEEDDVAFISLDIERVIFILLADHPAHAEAELIRDMAHELFHLYIKHRYTRTHKKSVEASNETTITNTVTEKYEKDRGEIASELYAFHHMNQRATQLEFADFPLAQALLEQASVVQSEVRDRLRKAK